MKKLPGRYGQYLFIFFVLFVALALIQLTGHMRFRSGDAEAKITQEIAALDESNPHVRSAIEVQNRHTGNLIALPEVVGTATGLTEEGTPAILVFTKKAVGAGVIPENLEGVPTVVRVTGEIHAMRGKAGTGVFPLPVPIGVSTGNERECSAGTIGARVKGGGNVYALSNNHVYALENTAPIGSDVLQPGLYDTQCLVKGNNYIGTLYGYVPISFGGGTNTVDAAIALSSTALLGNATPSYGTPNSVTVTAALGQGVQKHGRTSALTKGTITGINATVIVNYGTSGTATFINQITVGSNGPFIKPGDSGSLLVTDDTNANPVGLLFAGNSSGTFSVANRIGNVLSSFGVTIDGK